MNVEEILNRRSSKASKRGLEESDRPFQEPVPPKSRRIVQHPKEPTNQGVREEDEEDSFSEEVFDETALKKLILNFEKKVLKNQELRIKYSEFPEKFMDSEIHLNEVLQEMHVIATQPDLYPLLVELNSVTSLLGLLSHENSDIAIAVVDLLQELTDGDAIEDNKEEADALIKALMQGQVMALLVQNMDRLDESVKEESEGIHNTLGLVENITEYIPETCVDAGSQGLMQWLLKKLKTKQQFNANKLYASEILSILIQSHTENRQLLGEQEGIDVLLQQLAHFKRHDPKDKEEEEIMENLFNCLCSALLFIPNREKFLQGEGLQLMKLMLVEKKKSRVGALKVLSYAMSNPGGADNCNKFVDIMGLSVLFPLFMKTPKKKVSMSSEDHEEHVCSILASMLVNCKSTQRQRLMNKFAENDHEKVDRVMELHFQYLAKGQPVESQIEKEREEWSINDQEISADLEEEFYFRRLDAGLFTLQLVDDILMTISSQPSAKQRVMQTLNLRGGSIKTIRNIMREYASHLGSDEDKDSTFQELEKQRILQLVDKF